MKTFLTLFFAFFSVLATSQTVLEIGQQWTYSQNKIGGPVDPTYIKISGDTIINGIKWFIIEGEGGCAFNQNNEPFIRDENSKWYCYNQNEQTSSLLYDFDLTAGQSYTVKYFGQNFPIEVFVDSTSTISINGINRKIQYCSNPNSNTDGFYFGVEIIEGIGSKEYLLPQGNICDPHAGPIRCFSSNTEFVDFDIERECDESFFSVSTKEIESKLLIKIYPNPTSSNQVIKVESLLNIERIIIYNSNGSIVETIKPNSKVSEIKLNNAGIYYVHIESLNKVDVRRLIIIEE